MLRNPAGNSRERDTVPAVFFILCFLRPLVIVSSLDIDDLSQLKRDGGRRSGVGSHTPPSPRRLERLVHFLELNPAGLCVNLTKVRWKFDVCGPDTQKGSWESLGCDATTYKRNRSISSAASKVFSSVFISHHLCPLISPTRPSVSQTFCPCCVLVFPLCPYPSVHLHPSSSINFILSSPTSAHLSFAPSLPLCPLISSSLSLFSPPASSFLPSAVSSMCLTFVRSPCFPPSLRGQRL